MQSIYLGLVLEAKAPCIFLHSRLSTKEEKGTDMVLIGLIIFSVAWGSTHTPAQGFMMFGGGLVAAGVIEGLVHVTTIIALRRAPNRIEESIEDDDDGNET